MRDPGLDAGRTVAVDCLALGGTVQPLLQFRKMFGRFVFFAGLNQGKHLFLGVPGGLQQGSVYLATTKRGAGLSGSRGGIGHKVKQCLTQPVSVNP